MITRVDHEPVLRVGDLSNHIGMSTPGTVLRLQIWRARGLQVLDARLGETASDPQQAELSGPPLPPGQIGLQLRVLTAAERTQLQVEGGLVVESVTAPAGSLGLHPGDVLLAVNGLAVASVGQLRAVMAGKPPALALLVDRGGDRMYIPVEPN